MKIRSILSNPKSISEAKITTDYHHDIDDEDDDELNSSGYKRRLPQFNVQNKNKKSRRNVSVLSSNTPPIEYTLPDWNATFVFTGHFRDRLAERHINHDLMISELSNILEKHKDTIQRLPDNEEFIIRDKYRFNTVIVIQRYADRSAYYVITMLPVTKAINTFDKYKHVFTESKDEYTVKLGDLVTMSKGMKDADFWIEYRGSVDTVGKPSKEYGPYKLGIKVTATDTLNPAYLYYVFMHLHQQGQFAKMATGVTKLVNLKIRDLNNIPLAEDNSLTENDDAPIRIRLRGNEDSAKRWIKSVYTQFPENPLNHRQHIMSFGNDEYAVFELEPSFSQRGAVEVKWISAHPPRKGIGPKAMKTLTDLSQKSNITLTLYPWDKGAVSQDKLTQFYGQQGFKKSSDETHWMKWDPLRENDYDDMEDDIDRSPDLKGAEQYIRDIKKESDELNDLPISSIMRNLEYGYHLDVAAIDHVLQPIKNDIIVYINTAFGQGEYSIYRAIRLLYAMYDTGIKWPEMYNLFEKYKHAIIRYILAQIKRDVMGTVKEMVILLRRMGIKWPELLTIDKSINSDRRAVTDINEEDYTERYKNIRDELKQKAAAAFEFGPEKGLNHLDFYNLTADEVEGARESLESHKHGFIARLLKLLKTAEGHNVGLARNTAHRLYKVGMHWPELEIVIKAGDSYFDHESARDNDGDTDNDHGNEEYDRLNENDTEDAERDAADHLDYATERFNLDLHRKNIIFALSGIVSHATRHISNKNTYLALLNLKKSDIIKELLILVKHGTFYEDFDEIYNCINGLNRLNLNWPELDVIQKSANINANSSPSRYDEPDDFDDDIEEAGPAIDNVQGAGAVGASSNINYLGMRVYVKPSVFLKLAARHPDLDTAYYQQHMSGGNAIGAPFLDIHIPEEWMSSESSYNKVVEGDLTNPATVIGHEGRHRMAAILKEYGDVPIETHLLFRGLRRRHITDNMIERLNKNINTESRYSQLYQGPWFSLTDTESVNEAVDIDFVDRNFLIDIRHYSIVYALRAISNKAERDARFGRDISMYYDTVIKHKALIIRELLKRMQDSEGRTEFEVIKLAIAYVVNKLKIHWPEFDIIIKSCKSRMAALPDDNPDDELYEEDDESMLQRLSHMLKKQTSQYNIIISLTEMFQRIHNRYNNNARTSLYTQVLENEKSFIIGELLKLLKQTDDYGGFIDITGIIPEFTHLGIKWPELGIIYKSANIEMAKLTPDEEDNLYWGRDPTEWDDVDIFEAIAPHGDWYNELAMMKSGDKPVALVGPEEFKNLYKPILNKYNWVWTHLTVPEINLERYIIGQQGMQARIARMQHLVLQMNRNLKQGIRPKEEYHREMGRLLGYSDNDIDDFIKKIGS